MEEDNRYLLEHDRRVAADSEQREWERDDTRVIPNPKPAKRERATQAEWDEIRRHFGDDVCWICGSGWQSLHHIYPRGQGGDDLVMNLAPVCGSGTTGCHGLLEARNPAARAALRDVLTDANKWYLTAKLGHGAAAWLDRHYSELAEEAA